MGVLAMDQVAWKINLIKWISKTDRTFNNEAAFAVHRYQHNVMVPTSSLALGICVVVDSKCHLHNHTLLRYVIVV